jgi:hypothetical protein
MAAMASAEPALTLTSSASTILPADFAFEDVAPQPQPVSPEAVAPSAEQMMPPETLVATEAARALSPVTWWSIVAAAVLTVAGVTYALWPNSEAPTLAQAAPAATAAKPTSEAAAKLDNEVENQQRAATDRANLSNDPYAVKPPKPSEPAPDVKNATEAASSPANPTSATASNSTKADVAPADATTPAAPPAGSNLPAGKDATKVATSTPPLNTTPAAVEAAARPDAPTNVSSSSPNHVLKFDPLDFDPEHLSLGEAGSKATASESANSSNSIPVTAGPEAAAANALPVPAKPQTAVDLLPPPVDANQPIKSRRGPMAEEPSRRADVAQRLGTQVKSLRLAEMPLARFVGVMSSMAGVPITLDPTMLELNGISPRTPVSAQATDSPLDKILRDALAANRFELVEHDGYAAVVIPEAAEFKSVDFDVKDLVDSGDAEPVRKLIERFVAPESWKTSGGKGSIKVEGPVLHIEQSLLVRREALVFCERLRLARGHQPRSKYPPAMLSVESPYEKVVSLLAKPTTFTFMPWTRLADFVSQLEEMTGLTILVDWAALGEADFGPSSAVACSAIDRPWSESLDGILAPLGLAWWAVDGQTLQISTLSALERIQRVEFYPVSAKLREQFSKDEALVAALQSAVEKRSANDRNAECRMSVDRPSGRLIVRGSPAVHRFLHERLRDSAEPLAKHE